MSCFPRSASIPTGALTRDEELALVRLHTATTLSAQRTLAPRKDGKPLAWARAAETLRDALLVAQVSELTAAVT